MGPGRPGHEAAPLGSGGLSMASVQAVEFRIAPLDLDAVSDAHRVIPSELVRSFLERELAGGRISYVIRFPCRQSLFGRKFGDWPRIALPALVQRDIVKIAAAAVGPEEMLIASTRAVEDARAAIQSLGWGCRARRSEWE